MVKEDKINALSDILSIIPSTGRRQYAIKIVNELIEEINIKEKIIDNLKAKKIGVYANNYESLCEVAVDLMIIFGFSITDLIQLKKEPLQFFEKNIHKIKKPITGEYLRYLIDLYNYTEITTGETPKTLNQLSASEIEIRLNNLKQKAFNKIINYANTETELNRQE